MLHSGISRRHPVGAAVTRAFLACALTACAPWVQVEGPFRMESQGYEVVLPAGWWREASTENPFLLTKDGVSLQYISIDRVVVGDELPNTKKKFAKGMSPDDVAAVELEEARSGQGIRSFALVEKAPFPLAGYPGFKLAYSFKTEDGLRLRRVQYGAMVRDRVYRVQYQAAARYYFDKDLAAFERLRESFRITDSGI